MRISFSPRGWADYQFLIAHEPALLARVNELIRDTSRSPFRGIGKPEPLAGNLQGWWSRRMTREHRLVYRVTGSGDEQIVEIASCRFHYGR